MKTPELISRLNDGDPGWPEWTSLVSLVKQLRFKPVHDEYLGSFLSSPRPISFRPGASDITWPRWIPSYVQALYGLKAEEYEMAGGFAEAFTGERTRSGSVFAEAGNDKDLGYPIFSVPKSTFPFQTTSSGALLHINSSCNILYPDVDRAALVVLDPLEAFSRKHIAQVIQGRSWLSAYPRLGKLLD